MDYALRSSQQRYASTYPENEEILSWLRKEEPEQVLEPALPIIDPHHHLWDRRRDIRKYRTIVYGTPELMEDIYDGHNVIGTVYCQCKCWGRADGPVEMRPVGEVEVIQGVAAVSESGLYGPPLRQASRACLGIVGEVDLRHANVVRGCVCVCVVTCECVQ